MVPLKAMAVLILTSGIMLSATLRSKICSGLGREEGFVPLPRYLASVGLAIAPSKEGDPAGRALWMKAPSADLVYLPLVMKCAGEVPSPRSP
ncbi:hypothetical protein TNCV_2504181 [Trichonephila clavipes]|nr:hypothetical protein TNCV_2504181 [Trichonephila clavipes]